MDDMYKDDFDDKGVYSVQGTAAVSVDTAKRKLPVPTQLRVIDTPGIGFGFQAHACEFPVQTLKIDHTLYFKQSGKINFDMKQKGADGFARVTINVDISAGREVMIEDLPTYFSTQQLLHAVWLSIRGVQ